MTSAKDSSLDWPTIAAWTLTGVALVVEPISGVASLVARLAALGGYGVANEQVSKLGVRVGSLEERVTALEAIQVPFVRLSGTPLRLLAYCLYREASQLFQFAEAEDAITDLDVSPHEYLEAAEDLRDFGFIRIDPDLNHAVGIARTRLVPGTYIALAPSLLPDVDSAAEVAAVLAQFRTLTPDQYRLHTTTVLEVTGIPVARLDLILRGLKDLGIITTGGPGDYQIGSVRHAELTPHGRRLIRGAT